MEKDRCLFCRSRNCFERVVTRDGLYDEIACSKHVEDLHRHADETRPGVPKLFISSTGTVIRGDKSPFEEVK